MIYFVNKDMIHNNRLNVYLIIKITPVGFIEKRKKSISFRSKFESKDAIIFHVFFYRYCTVMCFTN